MHVSTHTRQSNNKEIRCGGTSQCNAPAMEFKEGGTTTKLADGVRRAFSAKRLRYQHPDTALPEVARELFARKAVHRWAAYHNEGPERSALDSCPLHCKPYDETTMRAALAGKKTRSWCTIL